MCMCTSTTWYHEAPTARCSLVFLVSHSNFPRQVRYLYATKLKKYVSTATDEASVPPAEHSALAMNPEVQVSMAERLYTQCDFQQCFATTTAILDSDPFHHACLPLHLACQVRVCARVGRPMRICVCIFSGV
jgi:hypothetical protein